MSFLPLALVLLSAALFAVSLLELAPLRRWAVQRRLSELQSFTPGVVAADMRSSVTRTLLDQIATILHRLGGRANPREEIRQRLMQAGFRHVQMVTIYRGASLAVGAIFATTFVLIGFAGGGAGRAIFFGVYGGLVGLIAPRWYLARRISRRQLELTRALPDALDLLVVCVEAGLGLNQALQRVSQEIGMLSPVLAHELNTVNLEIRAGSPRLEAIKALGERTGLDDLKSLAAMLVQTERFGTPVADALRAHASGLRVSRRQRAEEAAAKTTIKLLFPLVLFIFPPLYIVILGPAILMMLRTMSAGGPLGGP